MVQGVERCESSAEAVSADPEMAWFFGLELFYRGGDVTVYPVERLDEALMGGAVVEKGFLEDSTIGDVVALVSGFGSAEYEHEGVVSNC